MMKHLFLGVSLVLLAALPAGASNGMNMIGFGAESVSMGGADLAVTASPCSMNINPAGIAFPRKAELEFGLTPMNPSLNHTDAMGNDRVDSLERTPMPYIGYIHPLKGRVTLGVGLFVQGGMGAQYQDLATPFSAMANSGMLPPTFFAGDVIPNGDVTETNIAHAKLTPTAAWRLGEKVTLGLALNVSYVSAEMKMFPETSVMADLDRSGVAGDSTSDAFFGMQMQDASDIGFGARLGVQYRSGPLSVAGSYVSETSLDLDGGTMTMNLEAIGLGKVNYDAKMVGFGWPQQAGVGMAYQITPRFLLAGDIDWVDWEDAISTVTIEIDNPDVPGAPPSREIPFAMNWESQWVWALGADIKAGRAWAARVGYNHGDTPIPSTSLRPLFPAIAESHVTAGFGVGKGNWTFDLALEYVLNNEMANYSTDPTVNPFGPGSEESLSQFATHFLLRWTVFER